ncbi:DUF1326 domain-containing protein [Thermomicrobium sp. CFH 73360]|uniref:DUF1326 domain-containing protein n=1 Tax=Thermomicrobium sp. CFH 73360 TaxID=2951987 RepID=UPI00336BE3F4
MLESCSCDLLCPCWFDLSVTPDLGWCGTALVFDIQRGTSDGVDLSGRAVILAATVPGPFIDGNLTVRLNVDEQASPKQRRELKAILSGQKARPLDGLGPLIPDNSPNEDPSHFLAAWRDDRCPSRRRRYCSLFSPLASVWPAHSCCRRRGDGSLRRGRRTASQDTRHRLPRSRHAAVER